jgi:DNA replication protein DnaC
MNKTTNKATNKTQAIKQYCHTLKLGNIAQTIEAILLEAEKQCPSYVDFATNFLHAEVSYRQARDAEKRQKVAHLPLSFDLEVYDFSFANGLDKTQLNQLRELNWLEQNFNILLMGPSGTGKTYLAAGLCFDAVKNGYRAYFKTMDEIINILKMKDITRSATAEYKRIYRAHLLVIDDIMLMPVSKNEAVAFFNLINQMYERTSFIITTNKSPKEWAQVLNDEVLATALLDRLLYKCEIIKLDGNSYRMKNRKTIFPKSI